MKKAVSLIILLFGLLVIYQFAVTKIKTYHQINYEIKVEDVKFSIKETFENNKYYLNIDKDNYNFYYSFPNLFNKTKNIVTDVEYSLKDNLLCLYPVLKNNENSSIMCSDGTNIYSYQSAKDKSSLIELKNNLTSKNISVLAFSEDTSAPVKNPYGNAYYNNIDETITIWAYRGIAITKKENFLAKYNLNFDRYDNTLSSIVGKFYVTPNYIDNKLYETNSFFVINLATNKEETISLPTVLSNNSYINGVVDNKLYIFDKTNKIQMMIDPYEEEATIVGNMDTDCKYYNLEFETRNIYDFINNEIKFNYIDTTEIDKLYTYDQIFASDDAFYIYSNSTMSKIYKNNLSTKINLFTAANIKSIKVVDDNIYFLNNDTLERYNDTYGVRKLITYSEFKYNTNNIYDIYK